MKNFLNELINNFVYNLTFLSVFLILLSLAAQNVSKGALASTINNPFEPKSFQDFNFVVAGDFGCDPRAKETVGNMTLKDPELTIALGDLSYGKSADCWFDILSPLDNNDRLKISIGEHDLNHKLLLYNAYMKQFNLDKPFYSFDYQNVHFLAMATGKNQIIPYDISSDQYRFVVDDLKKAHNNRNIDWIIVYQFRSFYSSLSAHPGLDELQETYHPVFEKYGVDLVLQAHNHNYQRTYPLAYNERASSDPVIFGSTYK